MGYVTWEQRSETLENVAIDRVFCYAKEGERRGLPTPMVMIQIQLQPEIEAQLAAEARARGVALDQYIEKIVISRSAEVFGQHTVAEAIDAIRELRKGNNLSGLKIKDLVHEGHRVN